VTLLPLYHILTWKGEITARHEDCISKHLFLVLTWWGLLMIPPLELLSLRDQGCFDALRSTDETVWGINSQYKFYILNEKLSRQP
jgi:hypothetical protein